MRKSFPRLDGLFWRLTLSYILVTLVAAFTILFVVTLVPTIQNLQQTRASPEQILTEGGAMHPESYLTDSPPNEEALLYQVAIPLFDLLSKAKSRILLVEVLKPSGQIASITACGTAQLLSAGAQRCSATATNRVKSLLTLPQIQTAISTALISKGHLTESTYKLANGDLLIIQPVGGNRGQMVGALVTVVTHPPPPGAWETSDLYQFFTLFWHNLDQEGFSFILLAIALGTITGLLASRNLAWRLRQIIQASHAWSRGEFQVTLKDPAADEVGQLARDLNSMATQLQVLLASWQEQAVTEERNRLARELHDSVKQQVFSTSLLVRAARKLLPRDPQKAQQHLQEAEELARQIQQELVELIRALRPALLVNKGLAPVLRSYLVAWSRSTGIAFDLRPQKTHPVRPDIEDALFRVSQEALANVARHSKASQVEVELQGKDDALCLKVQDDGVGFEVKRVTGKGIGLSSMRERVEMLAGKLTIRSSPLGTVVEAWLPLSRDSAEDEEHELVKVKDG